MIPQIREINFPEYATLHEATVTLSDMGERTITTQIRIDGDVSPVEMGKTVQGTFSPMEVEFKGERFVLPVREPQASKDNTTRNALVDVTFRSWPIEELKRYFFFTIDPPYTGTAVPDKYQASVRMSIVDFVKNFRRVLQYYWPLGEIGIELYNEDVLGAYSSEQFVVEIDYAKIWDVLMKFYEIFGKRWTLETHTVGHLTTYKIKVNYPTDSEDITDHTFQYGYDGGLLKFERQVQEEDIVNVLLGRGGEKNLPYRYFKQELVESGNTWTGDPDAIPELANIYFDRLHDATFRWYVRGWMQNLRRDKSWDSTHTFPEYEESDIPAGEPLHDNCLFAFRKGRSDLRFEPIEYVADKWTYVSPNTIASGSIAKYGEHWGALDALDDIFPTIQGRSVSPFGRIDEVVDVSQITTDDIQEAAEESAVETSIKDVSVSVYGNYLREWELYSDKFTIPTGHIGNISYKPFDDLGEAGRQWEGLIHFDTDNSTVVAVSEATGQEYAIDALAPGTYRLKLHLVVWADPSLTLITGTFGIQNIVLYVTAADSNAWTPTFDIWVKNIWNTDIGSDDPYTYAERVWLPILGDHLGNEAKLVFSDGPMSGADYEFVIAKLPEYDTSHDINGVPSEWKITLYKSNAELDATGLFIPNSQVKPAQGNHFFFIGIDMPFYYVELAERELDVTKSAHLSAMKDIAPTWVISLDKVRINTLASAQEATLLADRFKTGIKVMVADPRFLPTPLDLFVQSITYRWQEATDQTPYIVPDVEVVLSDKIVPSESTISRIEGQISSIHSEYVRADMVEEIVRRVASSIFLKKTGESDISQSPTQFSSKVTSSGFEAGGVGGQGWGIYRSNIQAYSEGEVSEGDTVIEADRMIVRKELQVNSLVVNQINAQGGKEILSAAEMEVSKVIYDATANTYQCFFDQRRGSIGNTFVVGDIVMSQRYDSEWTDTPIKYYKMVVTAVGLDNITLSGASKDGLGEPEVEDVIVQYGHISNAARQYVIIRDVVGGGYEQMLSGLTATESGGVWTYADGVEYYFAGRQSSETSPRWFVGNRTGNQFLEYVDGKLTIRGSLAVDNVAGSTSIDGNLIQTGEISLGQVSNGHLTVYAGISGIYNENIAAWYGGPKVDHEASPTAQFYAKSLFRFNGSGYLAGGNIYWDQNGYGGIPGITWGVEQGQNVVTIGSNVRLASVDGDTVTDLLNAVNAIKDWFGEDANGDIYVKKHTVNGAQVARGLYGYGFITAGGINSGGGGGGATTLAALRDVDLIGNLYDGQVLAVGSNGKWTNKTLAPANIFPGLSGNPSVGQTIVWTNDGGDLHWAYGAAGGGSENAVLYVAQSLNDSQKAQARTNIGAGTSSFSGSYDDLSNKPTINATGNRGVPVYFDANRAAQAIDYLNIDPEPADGIIVPYLFNDLAFLDKRGATVTATVDGSPYTISDSSAMFDGAPTFLAITVNSASSVIVLNVPTPTDMTWQYGQKFYIDFGQATWRAQSITLKVYTGTTLHATYSVSNLATCYWRQAISSLGNNTAAVRLEVTLTNFINSGSTSEPRYVTRICELGLIRFNSIGASMLFMSRGRDDLVYRNISPSGNYSLGSASNPWSSLTLRPGAWHKILSGSKAIVSGSDSELRLGNGYLQNAVYLFGHPLDIKVGTTGTDFADAMRFAYDSTNSVGTNTSFFNLVPSYSNGLSLGSTSLQWGYLYARNIQHPSRIDFYLGSQTNDNTRIYSVETDGVYSCVNVLPYTGKTVNLGRTDRLWANLYTQKWYPIANNSQIYVEWNSTVNAFYFHGNVVATGQIEAGHVGSGSSSFPVSVSGSIVPTVNNSYSLGSSGYKFNTVYASYILGVEEIETVDLTVSHFHYESLGNDVAHARAVTINSLSSHLNASGGTGLSITSEQVSALKGGKAITIITGNYRINIDNVQTAATYPTVYFRYLGYDYKMTVTSSTTYNVEQI